MENNAVRLDSLFAPPGRTATAGLESQVRACLENPLVLVLLDSLEALILVLNEQRQILCGNPPLLAALERPEGEWRGLRPGEALGCVHASEGPEGCGTSVACRNCGAVISILGALRGEKFAEGECLLSLRREGHWEAREFKVRATPLSVNGQPLAVLVLNDISDRKRREVLESTFLHDLTNSLQGLQGWTEILQQDLLHPQRAAEHLAGISEHLTQTVELQRLLLSAEQGRLPLEFRPVFARELLERLDSQLRAHPAALGRSLRIVEPTGETPFWTDPRLLVRVLLNMAVNALEATPPGGTVTLSFGRAGGAPEFMVQNPGEIPPEIAPRIFQRSFSTKAEKGRGLGTYAMKLFGENHLGGEVGFRSTAAEGTIFYIRLPKGPLT